METISSSMNSWAAVFLLCGLFWHLASSQPSDQAYRHTRPYANLNCTFEENLCSWRDVSTARQTLAWTVSGDKRHHYRHRTGALRDHTTGHGNFLQMMIPYKYGAGIAVLESVPIVTNTETCLSFWYLMYGYAIGSLNVYRIGYNQGEVKNELFAKSGLQGKRWYRAIINTGAGAFKLQIEGTFGGENRYGDIAIDDVTFSYQGCQQDESTLFKDQPRVDCDFEEDFCSYFSPQSDTLNWHLKRVPSNNNDRNALPPRSNGSFYMEVVKREQNYGRSTKLVGPSISVDHREACLSFWYRVNGAGTDWFRVTSHHNGKRPYDTGSILFNTDEISGNLWIQGFVTLHEEENFYMTFSVSFGGRQEAHFSLDDIRLNNGQPCIEDTASLINCDFETDFCRWYMMSKKDEGDWTRRKGPTPTNSTGPPHDHTTGDGYYIFLDGSHVQEANLYSPLFSVNSSGACLSFWYYMHGADVNTLQLRSEGNPIYFSEFKWSLRGAQGNQWIRQNISIDAGYNIYLVFTAKRRYFPRSDIALDDISITFGATCEKTAPETYTDSPVIGYPEISRFDSPEEAATTTPTTTGAPTLEPPHLVVKGDINPAYNNSRIELVCQHAEEGVRVRWYRRSRGYLDKEVMSRTQGKSLLFDGVRPKDAGLYSCFVQPHHGYAHYDSNEVEITVVPDTRPSPLLEMSFNYGDVFHDNPYDVLVDAVVKLVCGFELDNAEYHWRTTSSAFNSLNLPKERILVLNGTQPNHTGNYSCRISKDEYMTAKSNELNIVVRPGKQCERNWKCYGDHYNNKCVRNRCQCSQDAVVHRRGCLRRPEKPKVTPSPSFLEFAIGESFYLLCEADEPVPVNPSYTFKMPSHTFNMGPLNIVKIPNATESDTGSYSCHVTYDGIDSFESESVAIQLKDFIDLNCDFDEDLCVWFQDQETDTANFVPVSSTTTHDHGQDNVPSGPFIQLDASNTTVPNKAILLSPTIDRMALDSCLSFWYRMHGPDVYSMTVWRYSLLYLEKSKRFEGTRLWTVIGDKGDNWFKQTVTVGHGSEFYIAFDATGQTAIDDITFTYRGSC